MTNDDHTDQPADRPASELEEPGPPATSGETTQPVSSPGVAGRGLRERVRATPAWGRWLAAALLALALILGIGAAGFALGSESGGRDGEHGQRHDGRGDHRGDRGGDSRGSTDDSDSTDSTSPSPSPTKVG